MDDGVVCRRWILGLTPVHQPKLTWPSGITRWSWCKVTCSTDGMSAGVPNASSGCEALLELQRSDRSETNDSPVATSLLQLTRKAGALAPVCAKWRTHDDTRVEFH